MRDLDVSELMFISGGAIRDSDQQRAGKCRADIERAGDTGDRMGFGRLGRLLGSAWGVENSRHCQDQVRLSRQRDEIERRRRAEF